MPKDKKKKSKDKKKGKSGPAKAVKTIKALADNSLVADIVAAALVGMASALKDSEKAKKLASKAGDELGKMAKSNARQGGAMWDLALNIGRQTLDTLAAEAKSGKGKK